MRSEAQPHTLEVFLEKWPAVRRHSVIEVGIAENFGGVSI